MPENPLQHFLHLLVPRKFLGLEILLILVLIILKFYLVLISNPFRDSLDHPPLLKLVVPVLVDFAPIFWVLLEHWLVVLRVELVLFEVLVVAFW